MPKTVEGRSPSTGGYWVMRHNDFVTQPPYEVSSRIGLIGKNVDGRQGANKLGKYIDDPDSFGDIMPTLLWPKASRPVPGHNWAWPAVVGDDYAPPSGTTTKLAAGGQVTYSGAALSAGTAQGSSTNISMGNPGAKPVGGSTVAQAPQKAGSMLPVINEAMDPDARFAPVGFVTPKIKGKEMWPKFPGGYYGIALPLTNEDRQVNAFFPADPRLIAVNFAGDPKCGTPIFDLDAEGNIDPERGAPLQSAFRVLKKPSGKIAWPGQNVIAWNIDATGQLDTVGGIVYDMGMGVAAAVGQNVSGFIDVGDADDQHCIGFDGDGTPINSAHISLNAYFRGRGGGVGFRTFDGPLKHDGYAKPRDRGPHLVEVDFVFDPTLNHFHVTGTKKGMHVWQAPVWQYIPNTPTETPPPTDGPPDEPTGGPPDEPTGGPPTTPQDPPPTYSGPPSEPIGFVAPGSLHGNPDGSLGGDVIPEIPAGGAGGPNDPRNGDGSQKGGKKPGVVGKPPGGWFPVGWGPWVAPWKWGPGNPFWPWGFGPGGRPWVWVPPPPRPDPNKGGALKNRVLDALINSGKGAGGRPPKTIEEELKEKGIAPVHGMFVSDGSGGGGPTPTGIPPYSITPPTRGPMTHVPGGPVHLPPAMTNELMFPSWVARPQGMSQYQPDLRYINSQPASMVYKHDVTTPVSGHIFAYGAQGGVVGADPRNALPYNWKYTQKPNASSWPGGTCNGGFWMASPEVGPEDLGKAFSPAGITKSTTYFGLAPGCYLGFGYPDLAQGGMYTGWRMGSDSSGNLTIAKMSSAGAASPTFTFPNADGSSGQVIGTDGAGNLSFVSAGGTESSSCPFTATATGTVGNTGAETTLIGSGVGSLTIGANTMAAGRTYIVDLQGFYSTKAAPVGNITLTFKFGSTTLCTTGAVPALQASKNQVYWRARVVVTCRTTGATGTVFAQGTADFDNGSGAYIHLPMKTTATVTIDTTASQAIGFTATWATADPSNTLSATNVTVQSKVGT